MQHQRTETSEQFQRVDQRFKQVDPHLERINQSFDKFEQRMEEGFRNVQSSIDRLGQRWGIRNEAPFRQTMREVLFGIVLHT